MHLAQNHKHARLLAYSPLAHGYSPPRISFLDYFPIPATLNPPRLSGGAIMRRSVGGATWSGRNRASPAPAVEGPASWI